MTCVYGQSWLRHTHFHSSALRPGPVHFSLHHLHPHLVKKGLIPPGTRKKMNGKNIYCFTFCSRKYKVVWFGPQSVKGTQQVRQHPWREWIGDVSVQTSGPEKRSDHYLHRCCLTHRVPVALCDCNVQLLVAGIFEAWLECCTMCLLQWRFNGVARLLVFMNICMCVIF